MSKVVVEQLKFHKKSENMWQNERVVCPKCFKRVSYAEIRTFVINGDIVSYIRCPKCGVISIIKKVIATGGIVHIKSKEGFE